MRNKVILLISILVIILVLLLNCMSKGNLKYISDEDKNELMKVLKIENASTCVPLEIKKGDWGFGDTTLEYTLKFEISKEEYDENELKYSDRDTTEVSLNWKEEKDENTYICYVREYEYNENREELFNELKKIYNKY